MEEGWRFNFVLTVFSSGSYEGVRPAAAVVEENEIKALRLAQGNHQKEY